MYEARSRFYYDLALSGNEFTMGLLMRFADEDKVLFGTDYPYAPTKTIVTHTKGVEAFAMSAELEWKVVRGNALKLFPRLRDVGQG